MDNIISFIVMVVMLGILVVVHEWGHFIVARIFKIRVDEFSIGFGPRALRIGRRGDTEYNVRWIPLGGYVKIAGMEADEEPINVAKEKARGLLGGSPDDANAGELPLVAENTPDRAETEEQRLRDAEDGFYSKPIWQRSLVIFAGPLMSFLLGVFIFCNMGWTTGIIVSDPTNAVAKVQPGDEAARMGLQADDKIVNINGKVTDTQDKMIAAIRGNIGKDIVVTVLRGQQTVVLRGKPHPLRDDFGKPVLIDGKPVGVLGFTPGYNQHIDKFGFVESQKKGLQLISSIGPMLKAVFSSFKSVRENTGSVLSIASMTKSAVKKGPADVAGVAGSLTVSLAIFNLLPIPILDGGHLLIFLIEALRRGRRLTPQQQQNFMLAGLICIGILFLAVMSNDVLKAIHGTLPRVR
ncbi:MAG TPA: M50 family metallopeptidase [Capsulimonadaceae bacterium]|jgi:regulator of sigma E protease